MIDPTPEDLARDLAADLAWLNHPECLGMLSQHVRLAVIGERARTGWPVAIRRALHAESQLRLLEAELDLIKPQQQDGTDRLCRALYGECRAKHYLGGSNARMLYDGADQILRLRALVESLAERVAAQSELLIEKAQRPCVPDS